MDVIIFIKNLTRICRDSFKLCKKEKLGNQKMMFILDYLKVIKKLPKNQLNLNIKINLSVQFLHKSLHNEVVHNLLRIILITLKT